MQISTSMGVVHAIYLLLMFLERPQYRLIVPGHKHRQTAAPDGVDFKRSPSQTPATIFPRAEVKRALCDQVGFIASKIVNWTVDLRCSYARRSKKMNTIGWVTPATQACTR